MTRMWCVDPGKMCRFHLLGEWKELGQLVGHVRAGNVESVIGHAVRGQVDVSLVPMRYEELRSEMVRRGYRTEMDLSWFDVDGFYSFLKEVGWVDVGQNEKELRRRCTRCRF